jgi:uncharacterized protein (DUF1800 family)
LKSILTIAALPRRAPIAMSCVAALLLSACGGGGSSGGGGTTSAAAVAATPTISSADAARLAKQGSFGPTQALVNHIVALGSAGAWVDEQTSMSTSSYSDLAARAVATNYCTNMATTAQAVCNRDYMSQTPVGMEFYAHAATGSDQLRQRVAFALSQIIVASDVEVHSTAGLAALNQIFLTNAFGNYHDILRAVALNPYMGAYLNLANSSKAAPNENFARELMQLFSIGVNNLNADGTAQTNATGATVPSYTADDVHNVARALTGWTYARLNGAPITDNVNIDYSQPMIANAALYDTTAKSFLGVTVAANATQDASLTAVIDAVFNNASTPPFVSKFLIEQLVTSNPSTAYVGRISAVFANDGSGVRGNLKAVVRAILTDTEARGDSKAGASDGKVKEPVLLSLSIGRLIGDTTDGYAFTTRDAAMGQQPFRAPSVFNFYPPDYPLPLGGGLLSPPAKLMTAATAVARHNLVYDWTVTGDAASRSEYAAQSTIAGATGTTPDWSVWDGFGSNTSGMLDLINLLMLNNTMSAAQRTALTTAVNAITNTDATMQAHKRAQAALYIVGSSPQFQVDR